jgi:Glycosyltransferase Family 4
MTPYIPRPDTLRWVLKRYRDVEVACSVAGVQAAPLVASNVPVNVLVGSLVKRRLSLRYVRALRRLLVQSRYDVVHAHLYASAAAAAAAAPRNTPLVLTEHTEAPWRSWRARAVSHWFYRRASHIVAFRSHPTVVLPTRPAFSTANSWPRAVTR